MEESRTPVQDIQHIRSMMEKSSTFLSLSGLSGVVIGIFAGIASIILSKAFKTWMPGKDLLMGHFQDKGFLLLFCVYMGALLLLALFTAFLFTWLKARRKHHAFGDSVSIRFAVQLFIPLAAGGLFIGALFFQGYYTLLLPAMLIFYGLALINASKYTLHDIGILGLLEVVLGCSAAFWPEGALILWACGFGLLTFIYGIIMFVKYEK